MSEAKEMKTPMHQTIYLGLEKEMTKVDNTQYREMIGSLLYLTTSKPDIMFNVCVYANHLTAIKRIFTYLIRTCNLGLFFKKRKDFKFTSYCVADYVGDKC